jgi:hypothetical protein
MPKSVTRSVEERTRAKAADVAAKLLEQFNKEFSRNGLDPASLPTDPSKVSAAILKLVYSNLLNWNFLPDALTAGSVRALVQFVKMNYGIGTDDVIDNKFLDVFKTFCTGTTTTDRGNDPINFLPNRTFVTPAEVSPDNGNVNKKLLIYRVVGELPSIKDRAGNGAALSLIDDAFNNWIDRTGLIVRREEKADTANVTISCVGLDGRNNDLARATVGKGPEGSVRRYSLLIDKDEIWTKDRFLATMCHEIGHLLGLDHSDSSKDLMYFQLTPGKSAVPTSDDIARAQRLWGDQ